MARGKRKRSKRPDNLDVDDILSGRILPGARLLIETIHDVNPTGDEEDFEEEARRYRLKSQLQSLLVNRFKEEIAVRMDADKEGVVLLFHRPLGLDACHAMVDDLDPDARAWVRLQIDTADWEDHTPRTDRGSGGARLVDAARRDDGSRSPERPDDVAGLIARGRSALDAYDYDEAGICFELAYAKAPGNAEATTALMDFLVEHMADYEKSLRLIRDHPFPRTEAIRTLGALAAARSGHFEEAASLANGLVDAQLAEVWLLWADYAIKNEQWDQAVALLDHARAFSPAETALSARMKAINEGRARLLAPVEAALDELFREGRFKEAGDGAAELLRRYPNSRTASRIIGQIEQQKRDSALRQATALADEALADGELALAVSRFKRVLDLGADKETIQLRIAAAETALKENADRAAVSRMALSLSTGKKEEGLSAYVDMAPDLRVHMRNSHPDRLLSWLDQLAGWEASKRAKSNAVTAVIALSEAVGVWERGDVEEAARMLLSFEQTLQPLTEYRRILDDDKARKTEKRRHRASASFDSFKQAVLDKCLDEALASRESFCPDDLEDAIQSECADLEEALRHALEIRDLQAAFEVAQTSGNLFQARSLARRLADMGETADEAGWREQEQALDAQIHQAWKLWVLTGEDAIETGVTALERHSLRDNPLHWLCPDGKTVVQGWAQGHWLFFQEVEVATSRPLRVVLAYGENPMSRFAESAFDGRVVSLCDINGAAVRMDARTWRLIDCIDYRPLCQRHEIVEHVFLADYLWIIFSDRQTGHRLFTRVLDTQSMRIAKELGDQGWSVTRLPTAAPGFATLKDERECMIFNERGFFKTRVTVPGSTGLYAVQLHPDREHLVFLATFQDDEEDDTLYVQVTDFGGKPGPVYRIAGSNYELVHELATSSEDEGFIFILYVDEEARHKIIGLRLLQDKFDLLFEVLVPSATFLVHDVQGRHAAVCTRTSEGTAFVRLGRDAPDVSGWVDAEGRFNAMGTGFVNCKWPSRTHSDMAFALLERLECLDSKDRNKEMESFVHAHRNDEEQLLAMAHAVKMLYNDIEGKAAERYFSMVEDIKPIASELQLIRASRHVRRQGWEGVFQYLDACDVESLSPESRAHYYHMRGLAYYDKNSISDALVCFQELSHAEKPCTDGIELLNAVGKTQPNEVFELKRGVSTAMRLLDRIRRADDALSTGDVDTAFEILDVPLVWNQGEKQSMARLCYALLRKPGQSHGATFRKIHTLASFLSRCKEDKGVFDHSLRLGEAQWDEARMRSVIEEAETWLKKWTPPASS